MNILVKNEEGSWVGIFEDIELMIRLRKEFRILPMAVGCLGHSLQNKIMGPPFVINEYQIQYLFDNGMIDINPRIDSEKYKVFKFYTEKGMIARDGMKFGCDFLLYPGDPLYCHSRIMVVVGKEVDKFRLVQLGRIANDCNKDLVFAFCQGEIVIEKTVRWINTGAR
jgi:tRNA splicing endonuclease